MGTLLNVCKVIELLASIKTSVLEKAGSQSKGMMGRFPRLHYGGSLDLTIAIRLNEHIAF